MLLTYLTLSFCVLTGHNSNKPTAKWNPVSAKGLDERGFLWVFLGKAFFLSDGWTGVKMVLTGCQRVYRMEKNKCHKAWHLQIEWDLFMQACHKSKTFFYWNKKENSVVNCSTDFQRRHFLYCLPLSHSIAAVWLSFNQNLKRFSLHKGLSVFHTYF